MPCPVLPGLEPRATDRHDAGGKTRMRLLPGVAGAATFRGERDEHRLTLWRKWRGDAGFILFLGMNPSTAEAEVDDNTIRIEQRIARDEGFGAYCKGNACSYRTTMPQGLVAPGVEPNHPHNHPALLSLARDAGRVVMTIGTLPPKVLIHGQRLVAGLQEAGIAMECLGHTASGAPRHVRGLPRDAALVPFDADRYLSQRASP